MKRENVVWGNAENYRNTSGINPFLGLTQLRSKTSSMFLPAWCVEGSSHSPTYTHNFYHNMPSPDTDPDVPNTQQVETPVVIKVEEDETESLQLTVNLDSTRVQVALEDLDAAYPEFTQERGVLHITDHLGLRKKITDILLDTAFKDIELSVKRIADSTAKYTLVDRKDNTFPTPCQPSIWHTGRCVKLMDQKSREPFGVCLRNTESVSTRCKITLSECRITSMSGPTWISGTRGTLRFLSVNRTPPTDLWDEGITDIKTIKRNSQGQAIWAETIRPSETFQFSWVTGQGAFEEPEPV